MSYKNAFLLTDNPQDVERGRERDVTAFTVATRFPCRFEGLDGVTVYKSVYCKEDADYQRLALMTFADESAVNAVIDAVYEKKAQLIVAAAYSLDETGLIDARYHLSPVQLLHKVGLLEGATVVGGVHLDRDDVDLMVQSKARLVLCPTASMGYGYGFPHYVAASKKLQIELGSGDNRFNRSGDMLREAETLVLGSNCDMRSDKSVTEEEALSLIALTNISKKRLFE